MSRGACPVCQADLLTPVVSIGRVPVYCNVLWPSRQEARNAQRGDIVLVFCTNCGHLFNSAFDPALVDYDQAYENSLHFSARFQQYAVEQAKILRERHALVAKTIVEIGCGQGDFLQLLCEGGQNRGLGFDPSYRREEGAQAPHIQFIQDYYSADYAGYDADFVCCRHVLEHVPQPDEFVAMVRNTSAQRTDVVVFFEVPNIMYTLRDLGIWDLIYEHFSYFSSPSLATLFVRNHFHVHHMRETFGGQFLSIEASPAVAGGPPVADWNAERYQLREAVGAFAERYREKVGWWRQKLQELADRGRDVVVWGSGSKGVTFLNVVGTAGQITRVVDINPRKQGMYVAGTGQEIVAPESLREEPPDVVIIMNPNYVDEINHSLQELSVECSTLLS